MFEGKRILIVDDSTTVSKYLHNLLAGHSRQLDIAQDGRQALALVSQRQYDLILLDLVLPDSDGTQVLEQIRAADEEVAIVILTDMGDTKSATMALRKGADHYVEKQEMIAVGDQDELLYALELGLKHRAGIVAENQLAEIKADFYSMVTHDLRNPAATVISAANLLLDGSLTPEQEHLIDMIRKSIMKMLRLVNDYLDYAKIDAGYLRLNPDLVDLTDVVRSSLTLAALQAQARDLTLIADLPDAPVHAYADAQRIEQVLDNLISNAIKYTPNGGQITVGLAVNGDTARLQVSDTGDGIPANQQEALFIKYHRVPGDNASQIQGTGLGLMIVKEIVEAHGGDVWVESEGIPGKGSSFFVTLPLEN